MHLETDLILIRLLLYEQSGLYLCCVPIHFCPKTFSHISIFTLIFSRERKTAHTIFLIFALKHRLWVLIRTASNVHPQSMFWSKINKNITILLIKIFHFSAERRAQLSRSRSRTNLFQLENSVTREISFDDTLTEPTTKPSNQNRRKNSRQETEEESEAEKLLARLKAL